MTMVDRLIIVAMVLGGFGICMSQIYATNAQVSHIQQQIGNKK